MPEEIIGSVWSECSVFVCLAHFIISDKSIKREMSLVRSGVSGEMSLGLPWSIRKYNYRSYFYENIILSWHIIMNWRQNFHMGSADNRMYTKPFLPIANCEWQCVTVTFPWEHGNQLTCSTLCISGIPCSRLLEKKCGYVLFHFFTMLTRLQDMPHQKVESDIYVLQIGFL